MTGYQRARSDFEALERIAELSDQVVLDENRLDLMENPTKARAMRLYHTAIDLWFREHGTDHPEAQSIYMRHLRRNY